MEQWKDIVGYEGFYQVSNLGNVRSVSRTIVTDNGVSKRLLGKVLSPATDKATGAKVLNLHKNGKERARRVHQLVAEVWLEPRPKGCVLKHGPGGRGDNSVDNLYWGPKDRNESNGNKKRRGRERWKDVVGYEGLYQVSNWGKVRSLTRFVVDSNGVSKRLVGRVLRPSRTSKNGSKVVVLCKNGIGKGMKVAQIVAEAWLKPCPDGYVLKHGRKGFANDNVSNLYWGPKKPAERKKCRRNRHIVIRGDGKVFDGTEAAAKESGCNANQISECCNGKRNSSGGYTWRYAQK